MIKFYTSVGQFRIVKDTRGQKFPLVYKGDQEYQLSIREMILWAGALWKIHTYDELEKAFYSKEKEAHIDEEDTFGANLSRLETRGLIVSGEDFTGEEALYKLISCLQVIPVITSLSSKVMSFMRLTFQKNMPLSVSSKIFKPALLTKDEKRILKLTKQYHLTAPELIACFDNGAYSITTDQELIEALYLSDADSVDLKALAYSSDNKSGVTTAIANLYLKQEILLQ